MFNALRLENFKSHEDTEWLDLRPLTIVVGPNNSGKSSLLDAVLLLKQTLDDQIGQDALVTSGALVDVGGYRDLVYGGVVSREVGIGLKINQGYLDQIAPAFAGRSRRPTELNLRFALDRKTRSVIATHQRYATEDATIFERRQTREGVVVTGASKEVLKRMRVQHFHFLPVLTLPERAPRSQKMANAMFEAYFASQEAMHMWRELFGRVRYMVPLRQPIPRFSLLGKTVAAELGAGGENLVRVLQNTEPVRADDERTILDDVNHWMADRFKMLGKLRIQELGESVRSLMSSEARLSLNAANMGEGIAQLLPIVVAAVSLRPAEAVLIEQPELHLHPAAQANLGDLFVETLANTPGAQYFIETHSEHFLLRVRRHIALGTLSADNVVVLYVEKQRTKSRITRLELDELGSFSTWPPGFFAEGYNESLELARAAQRRRQKS